MRRVPVNVVVCQLIMYSNVIVGTVVTADATNRNPTPVTTVTIPYIKGTSETISRILQPYKISVAHKPTTTLRQLLTNVKDKDEPNNRQGAIYKIKCSDCQAGYHKRDTQTPPAPLPLPLPSLSLIAHILISSAVNELCNQRHVFLICLFKNL